MQGFSAFLSSALERRRDIALAGNRHSVLLQQLFDTTPARLSSHADKELDGANPARLSSLSERENLRQRDQIAQGVCVRACVCACVHVHMRLRVRDAVRGDLECRKQQLSRSRMQIMKGGDGTERAKC